MNNYLIENKHNLFSYIDLIHPMGLFMCIVLSDYKLEKVVYKTLVYEQRNIDYNSDITLNNDIDTIWNEIPSALSLLNIKSQIIDDIIIMRFPNHNGTKGNTKWN